LRGVDPDDELWLAAAKASIALRSKAFFLARIGTMSEK
jgi:hypothetical protein